jgi:ABA DEFICIENT 4-like
MELETFFSGASTVAAIAWLPLAATPSKWTWPVRAARGVAIVLAFGYVALILTFWARGEGGFGSLAQVAQLFQEPGLLLAGWVHYLAFDLLVGSWEREEAIRIGLGPWFLVPTLILTFMFGPAGWLCFLGVRRFHRARQP